MRCFSVHSSLRFTAAIALFLLALSVSSPAHPHQIHRAIGAKVLILQKKGPIRTFVPQSALGMCLDGMEKGDMAGIFTPANIAAIRSAGLRSLAYRLRTELGVECWHWNPKGRWSNPTHRQGYWTSDAQVSGAILLSNGYALPRRGDTIDQANNAGYSRIDDGDPHTFWKSDPYLDSYYTHESNALHPQWIIMDLGKPRPVNAIRILWGMPYAKRYQVEYWQGQGNGVNGSIDDTFNEKGWHLFPQGEIRKGQGGQVTLPLCARPIRVRLVRIWMTESSNTPPPGAADVRDGLGYAVREIYLGWLDKRGALHDEVRHAPCHKQSLVYVSSTDPWHRAQDRDANVEQPGFDLMLNSGLTCGQPILVPVGLLYDTPENAVAELRWLTARGVPIKYVELGEEPDGQYISPEDYGALFVQWAEAIHHFNPHLALVGPGFQTEIADVPAWPNAQNDSSWVHRFLLYLKSHGHFKDLRCFSFEWYPFDDLRADHAARNLLKNPLWFRRLLARWRAEGVPAYVPWLLSEYGYSAFAGEPEVDRVAAVLNAEIVGLFLELGGNTAYLYGCEPQPLLDELHCNSWGNLAFFVSDDQHHIKQPLATYYTAWLLTHIWAAPLQASLELYPALCSVEGADSESSLKAKLVAFAVRHPSGRWALLLLNKDPQHLFDLKLTWDTLEGMKGAAGSLDVWQISSATYKWHPRGAKGYAAPDTPPLHFSLQAKECLLLPPLSVTVVGCQPD